MSLIISLCALLATFFELYLQRKHNEKSLKPIPQIVLGDQGRHLFVQVQNNGVGPLIIEQLSFFKQGVEHPNLERCLTINPTTYNHDTEVSVESPKVIFPGSHLEIFGMMFEPHEESAQAQVRAELATLRLQVKAKDIYQHNIKVARDFRWFVRHTHAVALSQE